MKLMLLGYKVFGVEAILSKFFVKICKFRKTFDSLEKLMKNWIYSMCVYWFPQSSKMKLKKSIDKIEHKNWTSFKNISLYF